jgi:hypothetical protein
MTLLLEGGKMEVFSLREGDRFNGFLLQVHQPDSEESQDLPQGGSLHYFIHLVFFLWFRGSKVSG